MSTDRADALAAGGLFSGLLVVYAFCACRTFGPGDSPQHVLSALTWGVSVAPGYPLYNGLAHFFSLLYPADRAVLVNFFSGLCHAAAAAGLFLVLRAQGLKRLPAAVAVVLLALSRLYWYYSEIAEVRALNDLLAVAAALVAVRMCRELKPGLLPVLGFLLGLGLSHHPTFVLILPAFAYWIWAHPVRPGARRWLGAAAALIAGCLGPYALLWARLRWLAPPVWNPALTEGLSGVWALFTRKTIGGPLRMVVGTGVFGFEKFDGARLLQHLGWFATACWTDLTPAGLALAIFGAGALWKKDRRTLGFWLLWLGVSSAVFIGISSQQLILCDSEYVRGMVARFYLLPYLGIAALAGFGAGFLLEKVRPAFGWALLAAAIAIPALARPMNLSRHNLLMDYCRLMIQSTGPNDMLVLAPDDSIFGMTFLELAEGSTGDRVLLVPSLFSSPAYIRRLRDRHPDLRVSFGAHGLKPDWKVWLELNPGRRLFTEAVNRDTVLEALPNSAPSGILGEVRLKKPAMASPAEDARRFLALTPDDFITRWNIEGFTQEIYLTRSYRMLLEWYGNRLGPKDAELAARLRARLAAL